jgi:uncharacterized metal-binding protein YceD (DUF177 family)
MEAHLADLPTHPLRLSELSNKLNTSFELQPNAAQSAAIADHLGIRGLKKIRFWGEFSAQGRTDWALTAHLGATVVQACVVSLDPVTTRIEESVQRRYVANFDDPDDEDVEMTADENTESLPLVVDVATVMIEALTLALPPYPRKDGAALEQNVYTDKGITPMTDEDAKPFAGLGALRDALQDKASDTE